MSEQIVTFNEALEETFETLDLYTTAITRAHGKNHPEAFEVREIFESMNEKVKASGTKKPDLDEAFKQLRKITDHYTVPDDVCETYAGVYHMLLEAEEAYYA